MDYMDGQGMATHMLLNGAHYSMPVTETPALNSIEIWTLINLTAEPHPIHLHLVRFQILDRRPFDLAAYMKTGKLVYTGPAIPPESHEAGWKDTVRADQLHATRIIVKFEGYKGRYVWHCHVLEHEDNEMMRPYQVHLRRGLLLRRRACPNLARGVTEKQLTACRIRCVGEVEKTVQRTREGASND